MCSTCARCVCGDVPHLTYRIHIILHIHIYVSHMKTPMTVESSSFTEWLLLYWIVVVVFFRLPCACACYKIFMETEFSDKRTFMYDYYFCSQFDALSAQVLWKFLLIKIKIIIIIIIIKNAVRQWIQLSRNSICIIHLWVFFHSFSHIRNFFTLASSNFHFGRSAWNFHSFGIGIYFIFFVYLNSEYIYV